MTITRIATLAAALTAMLATSASAEITISWTMTSNSLIGTYSGSFSAAELSYATSSFTDTTNTMASSDTSPSLFSFPTNNTSTSVFYYASDKYANTASTNKYNFYSGNTASGDPFSYNVNSGYLFIRLSQSYVADSVISGTLTINTVYEDTDLDDYFTFGNVVTLNGNPFITYVNGSAVPEPSTYAAIIGMAGLGLALTRRRRK